jgi:RimJ/RimL family protein N-acetyltransferase
VIHEGARQVGTGPVKLREIRREDAAALYAWRMDPASRLMFRSTALVPFEEHLKRLDDYFRLDDRDRWFVIEVDGRPVGTVSLYDLTPDAAVAEWGRLVITPAERGRGYGGEAFRLLLGHARDLGIRRLRSVVLEGNEPSMAIHRRLGFREVETREENGRRFVYLALDLEVAGR